MRISPPAVGLALAVTLVLTGCLPRGPSADPTPRPSSTPVFASEEEALAAAEAAYARLVALADQIFMEGGADAERLETVATGEFLATSLDGFRQVEADGWRSTGGTVFRDLILQSYAPHGGPSGLITVYVCEDISSVDVVDSTGASVVSPNRPDTTVFQTVFDLADDRTLLISSREVWRNEKC